MKERTEQLKAVLSDEAFVRTLLAAENEEAVQKMLADKGVEMSLTEIELMGEMIVELEEGRITQEQLEKLSQCGELSEDELEAAAGGNAFTDLFKTTAVKEIQERVGGWLDTANEFGYVRVTRNVTEVTYSKPRIIAAAAIGAVVAASIGYNIYDAVRRRW